MLLKSRAYYKGVDDEAKGGGDAGEGWSSYMLSELLLSDVNFGAWCRVITQWWKQKGGDSCY